MKKRRRKKQKSSKKLLLLAILVLTVGIGFASLQKYLSINGSASIDSNFDVEITGISKVDIIGNAYEKSEATYADTTATFDVGLLAPGDSLTYEIYVRNFSNMSAKLEEISIEENGSENITYEVIGISEGDILGFSTKKCVRVKISYTGTESSEVSKSLNIIMLFKQTSELSEENIENLEKIENTVPELIYSIQPYIYDVTSDDEGTSFEFEIRYEGIDKYINAALYDNTGKLLKENDISRYKILYNTQYSLYGQGKINYNGVDYTGLQSDILNLYLIRENNFVKNYKLKDNNTYEIVDYVSNSETEVTLPVDLNLTKVGRSIFVNDGIDTVIIPENFNLDLLDAYSLSGVSKIVNKTGEEISWSYVVGGSGNCYFETGICNGILITNE